MTRSSILVAVAFAAIATSPAVAQSAEVCSVMVNVDGVMRIAPANGYVVTGATTPLKLPEGYASIAALVCQRSGLTIGDNDYRVLDDLNVPLYIQNDSRTLVLEIVGGQFRVRIVGGDLTPSESAALQSALDRAQSLYQDDPH